MSDSQTSCLISDWEIVDADVAENPTTTLTVDSNDLKIKNFGADLSVNTWVEGFRKVVYMRNKSKNPQGVCNWKCYIDRYADLAGKTWEEAKKQWLATD